MSYSPHAALSFAQQQRRLDELQLRHRANCQALEAMSLELRWQLRGILERQRNLAARKAWLGKGGPAQRAEQRAREAPAPFTDSSTSEVLPAAGAIADAQA